jgi:hypothetical protein
MPVRFPVKVEGLSAKKPIEAIETGPMGLLHPAGATIWRGIPAEKFMAA